MVHVRVDVKMKARAEKALSAMGEGRDLLAGRHPSLRHDPLSGMAETMA